MNTAALGGLVYSVKQLKTLNQFIKINHLGTMKNINHSFLVLLRILPRKMTTILFRHFSVFFFVFFRMVVHTLVARQFN